MSLAQIEAMVRETIQRQVDTTGCGKSLVASDAVAVEKLVRNIVGNLVMAVADAMGVEE